MTKYKVFLKLSIQIDKQKNTIALSVYYTVKLFGVLKTDWAPI
ncbi:hypothetical protein VCRA2126O85_240027 [Vibrio crassostreae]|nr:hypothetical protein VCRA2125O83_220056 [Vibrio crassostreae]CAK2777911.1 hypothetical protein VCRA2126O85_240027 [Vibrio crassostreae]CAK2782311.1 hypothetical protein VCRA2126O86_250026 [Vibrio crassostreae]CAK2786310.1 hypothetical protein VCRA2126O84_250056 [Vibrio crassostreae]CAK3297132.1 hypothetical protein VCRA2128O101_260056 [Vibrio crassostreae]